MTRTTRTARSLVAGLGVATLALVLASPAATRQQNGGWTHIGGDAGNQRYTTLDQITPDNFNQLEVAWEWDGRSFGQVLARPIPIYVDGMLITVAGERRYVVAIDAATGETLWTFREPNTFRWEYSMRQNHGKGVAHAVVDGRDIIYVVTPAFFLHALDAHTGQPIEGFGGAVPVEGFPKTGTVDLLADAPARDAGTTNLAPMFDLDGKPRPIGATIDVGAYEFGETLPGDFNADG